MGKVTPSAARSLFSSSVRYKVAAFLSVFPAVATVEPGGEGLCVEEEGLPADKSEDTEFLVAVEDSAVE